MRFATILILILVAGVSRAQGGFMGDAAQGRQGRNGASPERTIRPEDEDPQVWTERTAIITPGDRVEYKFELKKGETVFAAATSEVFDAALAFVDAKGKELARNDDREPGDQSPFLTFRAPEAATYTLQVLSFRSAAGGRFTLKYRTFMPLDAPRGKAVLARTRAPNDQGRAVLRIVAKRGEIVDLDALGKTANGGEAFLGYLRVVGPTGVGRNDVEPLETPDGSRVFEAKTDGDYYVEYEARDAASMTTDFRSVATVAAKPTEAATFDLAPGELEFVEFPVTPGEIVRTTFPNGAFRTRLDAPGGTRERETEGKDPAYGDTAAYAWFRLNRDSDADEVRVFHVKGTVRLGFRSTSKASQTVVLRNSETLPEWTPNQTFTGDLPIGDVRLFVLRTTPAELEKVFAKGERFQIRLDYFNPNGALVRTLMDRTHHVAEEDRYDEDANTYLVRLACDGYGGAGTYTLRRDLAAPTPFAFGTLVTAKVSDRRFALYSIDLDPGRYQLVADGNGDALSADLLDETGKSAYVESVRFDKVRVWYFAPPRKGRYRLWLRGDPGTVRFRLEPTVAPTLEGGKP